MEQKFTVGMIVSNHFGVLNRVAGLYAKRCYNIDSLAVGATENPEYSRITIVSKGDEYMKEQVVKQLKKLHDVKKVFLLDPSDSVSVEHMLIKLKPKEESKNRAFAIITNFGGNVLDHTDGFITAEITGHSEKIDKFIEKATEIGIAEVCRSGLISMGRGMKYNLELD